MSDRVFVFESYEFVAEKRQAIFHYSFTSGERFTESVIFNDINEGYDERALDSVLFLAFIVAGVSYYKAWPSRRIKIPHYHLDKWQAEFLNNVYQEGLSQFAFENNLKREDLAFFEADIDDQSMKYNYEGRGVLAMQSGGKDSLLLARLLEKNGTAYGTLYISSTDAAPSVISRLSGDMHIAKRHVDVSALKDAAANGAYNGHVPVTFIVGAYALVQAVLLNKSTVLTAIGHEGEEPHAFLDDLPVTHQWSKTWPSEQLFAEYVSRYTSSSIRFGSPLRHYSELHIAEMFVDHAWKDFSMDFSSCNRANYAQSHDNKQLTWCASCPKCANSYLLFAPFVSRDELAQVFGHDLFEDESLSETFKGLLGVDGVMKPFECIGEVDELRRAYHMALDRGGFQKLPFDVPTSEYDYHQSFDAQDFSDLVGERA